MTDVIIDIVHKEQLSIFPIGNILLFFTQVKFPGSDDIPEALKNVAKIAETVVDLDERAEKLEHIVEKIIEKIQHKFGGSKEFSSSEED